MFGVRSRVLVLNPLVTAIQDYTQSSTLTNNCKHNTIKRGSMSNTIYPDSMPSISIEVDTPDGIMYVTIMEVDNQPVKMQIIIGKAGTAIMAWAQATSDLATAVLSTGAGVNKLIEIFSMQTSGSAPKLGKDGLHLRSGPEGVCKALIIYRTMKFRELSSIFNGDGPSVG
jgi:hypothetical protein